MSLFYVLCSSTFSYAQETISADSICWTSGVKLKWSDFLAEPDTTTQWYAICPAAIKAQGFWDGLPNFDVSNCFMKKIAWTRDTTSIKGLEHEQLHFDIAEIHARRMRKAVDSLRNEGIKTFDPYSQIVQALLARRNKIDSLYDKESEHSINIVAQDRWKEEIENELKQLEDYAQ